MPDQNSVGALSARLLNFALNCARKPGYAREHPGEAGAAAAAALLLVVNEPKLLKMSSLDAATQVQKWGSAYQGTADSQIVPNLAPGVRDMYNQLLKDDPKQARAFLIQEMMAGLKLMGEILSNVSKTRSEISMTFARNARA